MDIEKSKRVRVNTPDLEQLLKQESSSGRRRRVRNAFMFVVIVTAVIAGYLYWSGEQKTPTIRYVTEPAKTGNLVVRVSATGKLRPTNQVDVGSELSGIIEQVFVDENDRVSRDQLLAQLDLSQLEDKVVRAEASLAAAEAQVMQAQATVDETRSNYARLQRLAETSTSAAPSATELEAAAANAKRAEANLASARSGVTQAKADLQSGRTNMQKASIRSPFDGVVLVRSIEPGQTVAASFQAPVLFTLAEDLSRMELLVEIDEADVGKVDMGQRAIFTVDAWPGRKYDAVITKVGFGATETEGVVTYPATLQVDNPDLSLRPGMTASADITTLNRDNALLVPNAALRYVPPSADTSTVRQRGSLLSSLFRGPPGNDRGQQVTITTDGNRQTLFVLDNNTPLAVEVTTGASNGSVTEITGGELRADMQVITDSFSE